MEFDIRHILRSLLRFWWLLLIGAVLFGSLGYFAAERQTPMYSAHATLQIEPVQSTNLVDYNALMYAERLTQTFQRMITFRPVLEPVIQELKLPYTPEELAAMVTATTEINSQLLIVRVTDPNPEQASLIANTIAKSFQNQVASQTTTIDGGKTFVPSARILIVETAIPPIGPVSDALVVAANTDAILLVCRSGRTRLDALNRVANGLNRTSVRVVGMVVNLERRQVANGSYYRDFEPEPSMPSIAERIRSRAVVSAPKMAVHAGLMRAVGSGTPGVSQGK